MNMKKTKLFNGFGFAGQHGNASEIILKMYDNQQELLVDVPLIKADVTAIKADINAIASDLTKLTAIESDLTKLKALINVTVTFDTDGGSTVESQTIPFGTVATLPEAPTKEGYTITGWYLGENPFNYETLVESNITLTAHWEADVVVSFNADGGAEIASQTIAYGTKAILPDIPTKEGFTFDGWYIGETLFSFDTLVLADTVLTAHWIETVPEG